MVRVTQNRGFPWQAVVMRGEPGDFPAAVKSQTRGIELLMDEQQKVDFRSRLALYQAKRPYRQVSSQPRPTIKIRR